ncbi:hypothetical protein [Haloparvum sedimenti]|uniref:hypothetical protein n=1 Tax=Haloparvum sedimenti TaxID=1678448 RepID=UPI000AEA1979|nr:hypothetical protein [Haloparvum sedimenti]
MTPTPDDDGGAGTGADAASDTAAGDDAAGDTSDDTASDASDDADDMEGRMGAGRAVSWVVLVADRRLVAAGILLVVFCTIVALGVAHPVPAGTLLERGDSIETLFNALVGSTITGVTLVLTLSQLILSQELGPAGDQRERMEGALSFRDDAAEAVGEAVAPAEPAAFLRTLVEASRERAAAFGAATDGRVADAELAARIGDYVEGVTGNAASVARRLEGAEFGTFDVLLAALDFNYSRKIHEGKLLLRGTGDQLPDPAREELTELVGVLQLFGPAREHVKTLYFQWELSNLSRVLLAASVPAVSVAIATLVFLDPQDFTATTLGVADALWLVAGAATVTIAPFALLLSYILRIVTVAKRTLSIGPFVLRETDGEDE